MEEAKRRIKIDPLDEDVESDTDDEDVLEVFGDLPIPPPLPDDPTAIPLPPSPPPAPDDEPPPPPSENRPYRKWWDHPPPPRITRYDPPPKRWVHYDTSAFSSDRLRMYNPVQPFPIPGPMSMAAPRRF